jgi:hypothetical protein
MMTYNFILGPSNNSDSLDQWAQQYWSAFWNPVQTQQTNVGQQLAAGPTAQQPQQQQQATQMPQVQQQQASQQQAPASVPQSQTIGQPQSNVGMVQKVDTAPASIDQSQAIDQPAGVTYFPLGGKMEDVLDEVGQVVQQKWVPDAVSAPESAANDQNDAPGSKKPEVWNSIIPDIQQGGLDQQTIDTLGKFQNNPNFHGGKFNPEEWEEGPMWIPESVQGDYDELLRLQSQGGDPTDYAGQMEHISNVQQYAFRNKVTGEVIPISQLFRELPQDAASINTKIAEYARSKPWWKEDLAPGIIKGISAAIAAAAGGAMLGPMFGAGAAGAGVGAGAAGTLGTAAGMGTGAALAQNAMMEGDIGDRLLPTALAFGSAAALPYVSDYVGGLIPDSWKSALGFGGDQVAEAGTEEVANAAAQGGGAVSEDASFLDRIFGGGKSAYEQSGWPNFQPENGVAGYGGIDTLPSNYGVSPETLEIMQSIAPDSVYTPPAEQIYMTRQPTALDEVLRMPTEMATYETPLFPTSAQLESGQYIADAEAAANAEGAYETATRGGQIPVDEESALAMGRESGGLEEPMYAQEEGYKPIYDTRNLEDLYGKSLPEDIGSRAFADPSAENVYASFGVDAAGNPLYGYYPADPTINYPTEMNMSDPRWWSDLRQLGEPTGWSGILPSTAGFDWGNLKDYIPSVGTLAALTSLYRMLFPTTPEITGGETSVHAGGGADAGIDLSSLGGRMAGMGGGESGPGGGSGRGGGGGDGGMLALMNLILNEMQKGGKYYFQT